MTDAWGVIHHVRHVGGDVAVASNHVNDPEVWAREHYRALRNFRAYQAEVERWAGIADEMAVGLAKAEEAEWGAI